MSDNKASQSSKQLKYAKVIKKEKSFSGKKNSNETKSSNEELAASIGFRNGVYPRLQGYQPQWISSQHLHQQQPYQQQQQQQQHQSYNNFKRNQALFEQQNYAQASDIQQRGSSFRVNPSNENQNMYNNSSKLKHSESARNNYSHKEMGRSFQDLTRTRNVNYNNVYEEYPMPNDFYMDENSEFILKPAASSNFLSTSQNPNFRNQILIQDPNFIRNLNRERMAGVFIPVKPVAGNVNNKKNLSNYNPLNEYNQQANFQSDQEIMKNAKYIHHDVYY